MHLGCIRFENDRCSSYIRVFRLHVVGRLYHESSVLLATRVHTYCTGSIACLGIQPKGNISAVKEGKHLQGIVSSFYFFNKKIYIYIPYLLFINTVK